MIVKQIVDEDFVNYKKPSMFIAFPNCDWKCERECGMRVCQNGALATSPNIEIDVEKIVARYLNNPLTSAVVIGGLEPFDSFPDLYDLIAKFRKRCNDDIVIYTGYTEDELHHIKYDFIFNLENDMQMVIPKCDMFQHILLNFKNIVIKFGRFVPNQTPHYDDVLGVNLASDNQYAKRF